MISEWDSLITSAEALLRRSLDESIRLHDPETVKDGIRCRVVRCRVRSDRPSLSSVILKQNRSSPEEGRFFTDGASLQLLSSIPEARGIAPAFLAGDAEQGLCCIEDLGGSESLEHVLLHGTREDALGRFRRLAEVTARMHAATRGREEEFLRLRHALPEPECVDRKRDADTWRANLPKLLAWFEAVGVDLPRGFEAGCESLATTYADPGHFLTFTHGDPAPSNNHVRGDRVRLLDFEYGGYRHALYDLTAWQVLCPMPEDFIEGMCEAYRERGTERGTLWEDEEAFRDGWARMCAYRALAILTWVPPSVLAENRSRVGEWTARHAVLSALERMAEAAGGATAFASVTDAADRLERRLRDLWPEITTT
ncbi:MAG: hypothetical protein KY468_20010, partial [Armatimonadetes bacterium]|nr:hypothetical protein [Armatimonadota bacterium]